MLDLKKVTLVCVDSKHPERGLLTLINSSIDIEFHKIKLFHPNKDLDYSYDKIESVIIDPINSKREYSEFMLRKLNQYIDSEFALVVQWDGYILNSEAWKDEFFDYDYIGAIWVMDNIMGNGGFSLRSKKLLEICSVFPFEYYHPEDVAICRGYRDELKALGINFAPNEIAHEFSVENEPYTGQFGSHGGIKPQGYYEWLELKEMENDSR